MTLANPYLELFERYAGDTANPHVRALICPRFAWGVPTEEAIRALAELEPIVEVGAGTGYWAWMLDQLDVNVFPVDIRPGADEDNAATEDVHWRPVMRGDSGVLRYWPSTQRHTLLLCWPPPSPNPMAVDCLEAFRGDTFAYVGDFRGACGGYRFHRKLLEEWDVVRRVALPRWPGQYDLLTIWKRAFSQPTGGKAQ